MYRRLTTNAGELPLGTEQEVGIGYLGGEAF
jgi:hypothetical protein